MFKIFTLGDYEVNTYIIACDITKKAAVIDFPSDKIDIIKGFLDENNLSLEYLLLTHGHFDHVLGAKNLQDEYNVPVHMSKEDEFLVKMLEYQLMLHGFPKAKPPENLVFINETTKMKLGEVDITIIETPGHSPGGLCFYFPTINKVISGDTLFALEVGRTDLPGGSFDKLSKSIKEKLFTLPDSVTVYPGHGPSTTIERERLENPYVGLNTSRL